MPVDRTSEISTFKGQERALHTGRIGATALMLSVLAATAPMQVVAGLMPATYAITGIEGQPLVFAILAVVVVLFGVGYAEMSRHVHNAGALYAYIARGLGGTVAAGASWVALVTYSALQVGAFSLIGHEVAELLRQSIGVTVPWWVPALVVLAVIGVLGALKICLNAWVLGVLLAAECLLILVLDLAFIADPGSEGITFTAFDPSTLGSAGLGTAMCFILGGFLGFETSPVYAEETHRPQVAVVRAMLAAICFTAVFHVFSSWALSVAVGPGEIVEASREFKAGLVFELSVQRLGAGFSLVISMLFATSIFASMLSLHNVVARYAFAMGRDGLLPAAVGRASRTTGAPAIGSLFQSAVGLIVIAAFTVSGWDTDLFARLAGIGLIGLILLMCTTSLSIIVFFVKRGGARAQAWRLTATGIAGLALLAIPLSVAQDFRAPANSSSGLALSWVLPAVIGAAALGGLVRGLVLRVRKPGTYARIGLGNEAFQLEKAAASQEAASDHIASSTVGR